MVVSQEMEYTVDYKQGPLCPQWSLSLPGLSGRLGIGNHYLSHGCGLLWREVKTLDVGITVLPGFPEGECEDVGGLVQSPVLQVEMVDGLIVGYDQADGRRQALILDVEGLLSYLS